MRQHKTFSQIRDWARERGIYQSGDSKTQFLKLQEEAGELAEAILKQNDDEFYDAVGDCMVVLTNIVELYELERLRRVGKTGPKYTVEFCLMSAYKEISERKGKMQNGTFVKDA